MNNIFVSLHVALGDVVLKMITINLITKNDPLKIV